MAFLLFSFYIKNDDRNWVDDFISIIWEYVAVDRPLAESTVPKTKCLYLKIGHPETLVCFVGDCLLCTMVNHH